MKGLSLLGIVLILLGALSFVVPLPHRENHGVKIGDAKIGIQTQTSERLPIAASIALLGAGALALVLGSRNN